MQAQSHGGKDSRSFGMLFLLTWDRGLVGEGRLVEGAPLLAESDGSSWEISPSCSRSHLPSGKVEKLYGLLQYEKCRQGGKAHL